MGLKPIAHLDVRIQITPASQWAAIGNTIELCSGAVQSKLGWNTGHPV